MKVLIADKFQADGIDRLEKLGCEVSFQPDLSKDELVDAMVSVHPNVLVVRSTKVNAQAIENGDRLSLIVRAGAGYDTIDVATASRLGIYVANCPGKNSIAVAELTWALILSCDRRVPDQTQDLRAHRWDKKKYAKAKGLFGRTLGIVGTGRIGMEVAKRGAAFGMKVVAWSRSLTEEKAVAQGLGFCRSLEDLAKVADVVSVNVAANSETANLINGSFLDCMKPGAFFINTSRGSVVDQEALEQAIREKGIRAGLDVFANEPGSGTAEFVTEIASLEGVYGTHHVGASTDQAQAAIADEAVRIIASYLELGEVPNCVNLAKQTPAKCLLTVRHKNVAGVLAHVFQIIGESDINVEEMENVIYDGADAACAKIQLSRELGAQALEAIQSNANILSLEFNTLEN